jgi:zinc and cadmium transporter
MTLTYILLATFAGGALSAALAGALSLNVLPRIIKAMVSLAAGALLATALLHLLPEAFESGKDARALFAVLLGGFLFFFLLEKVELYRHSHHHEGDEHDHHHGFDREEAERFGKGGFSILVGDGLHNFCDGVLIAAAFLADTRLGVLTALAVIAHEIPHEIGAYIVLLHAGFSKRRALLFNVLSGCGAMVGGVAGYFALEHSAGALPYLLVFSSASFLYVAVADLIPQMQQRIPPRALAAQLFFVALGVMLIAGMTTVLHRDAHGHVHASPRLAHDLPARR